ncbi:hypothetical protein FIA58_018595 [Flavobacterium jejuense]|uniref:Uncharacterized protein n=1 Tax=Flavobacterium jejuense TaxID=1544455 RepID=A0ABX0IUV2_9FLAO|nr:hypothetical protein [Flavobacterium jejuense]NHN27695.1 hypothetical protein [Flavobacterium jejuense]
MKKSIKDLKFSKNVISKFAKANINGGLRDLANGDTYTCANSPMTSCNGQCPKVPQPCDTSAETGCVESVDIC